MAIAVLPALIPDIRQIYDIYFRSFGNDKMGELMIQILFPQGTDSEEFRAAHTAGTLAYWQTNTTQYTQKVIDMETGDIIGMCLGDLYLKERTPEERANHGVPWLEGAQRERAEAVLNPLWEMREKLFGGRRYLYSHVIAVDPKHQGRKVGAALVKWGADLCEMTGLPCYFESSPTTAGLYLKMGWELLPEQIVHKKEVLGTDEDIVVPLMVRMPSSAGMTFAEWRAQGYPDFTRKAPTAKPGAVAAGKAPESVAATAAVAASTDPAPVPVPASLGA